MPGSPAPPSRRRPPAIPRWAPWIALLSVLFAGAIPWLACPRLDRWRAGARAEEALGALEGCLLGGDNDDPDDARLRARAIAEALAPATPGSEPWPQRCQIHGAKLAVALADMGASLAHRCEEGRCCPGDGRCEELGRLRERVAQARAAITSASFQGEVVAATFAEARRAGLAWAPRAGPPPPSPATPKRAVELEPLWPAQHDASALAATGDGRFTLLLHQRERRIGLCTVRAADAVAACFAPPAALPLGDVVLLVDGSTEAPAHLLVRHRLQPAGIGWGLYRASDGARLLGPLAEPLGAAVGGDGLGTVVVTTPTGFALEQSRAEGDPVNLALGEARGPPLLYGERLYWVEARADGTWLMARALDATTPPAALASLGDWIPAAVSLHACRGQRQLALLLTAEPVAPGGAAAIALEDDGRWTLSRLTLESSAYGFTCEREGASLTWIERDAVEPLPPASPDDPPALIGEHRVVRLRCGLEGCSRAEGAVVLERHHRGSRYLVGSLDEAVVLLWRSRLGDVRMKLGPLAELATVATVSLLDDEAHGGFDWEGAGVDLLAREGRGLLLLHADGATYAFALDAAQGARPIVLER